jgi:GTPase SAR1 family protein
MAITKAYYRNALGALIVFDILKASTFQNLDQWYSKKFFKKNFISVLIGIMKYELMLVLIVVLF